MSDSFSPDEANRSMQRQGAEAQSYPGQNSAPPVLVPVPDTVDVLTTANLSIRLEGARPRGPVARTSSLSEQVVFNFPRTPYHDRLTMTMPEALARL